MQLVWPSWLVLVCFAPDSDAGSNYLKVLAFGSFQATGHDVAFASERWQEPAEDTTFCKGC